jgi:hypothetical protein
MLTLVQSHRNCIFCARYTASKSMTRKRQQFIVWIRSQNGKRDVMERPSYKCRRGSVSHPTKTFPTYFPPLLLLLHRSALAPLADSNPTAQAPLADSLSIMVMSGLLGAYEMGRTLGEGSFGKVKLARHRATGVHFAVKVLDRARILTLRIHDQVRTTACVLHHRPPGRFSID